MSDALEETPNSEYWDSYCVKKWQSPFRHGYFPSVVTDEFKQPVGGRVQHRHHQMYLSSLQASSSSPFRSRYTPAMACYYSAPTPTVCSVTSKTANEKVLAAPNKPAETECKNVCKFNAEMGKPLAVPDILKLRYMHNYYITRDDWY